MLSDATEHMNEVLGVETFDYRQRVNLRKKLNKIAGKSIKDLNDRIANRGCDVTMEPDMEPMEEEDAINLALPEHCKEAAAPLLILGRKTRDWINKWNACGSGPDREAFRNRQWKRLRIMRAAANKKMGC